MTITTEEQDKLADLYDCLLWYEKFSQKLPPKLVTANPAGLTYDVLFQCGWIDGWLERAKNSHTQHPNRI